MTAISQAQRAYGHQAQPVKTPRATEYDAFARITQRIKAAMGQGTSAFPELAAALHDNRRLWALLAADVANKDNPLPQDLRARIVYLAEFTMTHSQAVLNKAASAQPLIDINMAMMGGLRDKGPGR